MKFNLTRLLVTVVGATVILLLGQTPVVAASKSKEASTSAAPDKVYKTRDSQGRPVFTDQAPEDAEEVKLEKSMTFPGKAFAEDYGQFTPAGSKDKAESGPAYSIIEVTYPANDETIRSNPGNVSISYRISPAVQPGHQLQLIMDGTVLKALNGKAIALENIDRGTHTVKVQVIDSKSGEEVQASESVSFTILRHSILNRPPS